MITPLIVHNYYRRPGGEDQVFAAEESLLRDAGHRVVRYTVHNRLVEQTGRLSLFVKTLWNRLSQREILRIIRREKPDVVHFHNTFPLISPAAYYAAKRCRLGVVQTLHNYRLLCPEARFFRNNTVCELCLKKRFAWPAVVYACYQKSRMNSAGVAAMLCFHRALGTWRSKVDRYIVLSEFARQKFLHGGMAPGKLVVKPNFLPRDPGAGRGEGGYLLFVGRLSPEKGLATLLKAWPLVAGSASLKIVGGGPLAPVVVEQIRTLDSVDYVGETTHDTVMKLMKGARAIIIPSLWYEGFPMTVVEAYASGLPILASRMGSLAEIVCDGETGLLFRPGDPADLAARIDTLLANADICARMQRAAREEFERKYTAGQNYRMLIDIYTQAIADARH